MNQRTMPGDYVEGCTQGRPWTRRDTLVAELAVLAHRQQLADEKAAQVVDAEVTLALCVASRMGLLLFVIRFVQFVWCLTWHGGSVAEEEDECRSFLFHNGPEG